MIFSVISSLLPAGFGERLSAASSILAMKPDQSWWPESRKRGEGRGGHEDFPFIFKVGDLLELIGKLQKNLLANVFRGLRQFGGLGRVDNESGVGRSDRTNCN